MHRRRFLQAAALLALSSPSRSLRAQADTQIVTDIVGRTVTLRYPLRRIFLAEGNLFYTVAALNPRAPMEKLVGWRDNFRTADLDSYRLYLRYFPELAAAGLRRRAANAIRSGKVDRFAARSHIAQREYAFCAGNERPDG